jgi:hypothetical protein
MPPPCSSTVSWSLMKGATLLSSSRARTMIQATYSAEKSSSGMGFSVQKKPR